jgi:hypothetical protein
MSPTHLDATRVSKRASREAERTCGPRNKETQSKWRR